MQKIVEGSQQFKKGIFPKKAELFGKLDQGQSPKTMFITCSDSRIDPHLITQSEPGELFILRNAGNIVPDFNKHHGAESGTIEYAVSALKVTDIVVCGHTRCGAVGGLLNPESLKTLPAVAEWVEMMSPVRQMLADDSEYNSLSDDEKTQRAIETNVHFQIQNLKTHPSVAAGVKAGTLKLHGWVYQIGSGECLAFDANQNRFATL